MNNTFLRSATRICVVAFLVLISVGYSFAQEIDIVFSPPSSVSKCGLERSFELIFSNVDTFGTEEIIAEVGLPEGVILTGVSSPGIFNPDNQIVIPGLKTGGRDTVEVFFEVGCSYTEDDLVLPVEIVAGGTGQVVGENIQVLFADLSLTSSTPAVLPLYLGLETTVSNTIVNNGFGELSGLTYCVSNNLDYLALQRIMLGSVDIAVDGPIFTSATQACFAVSMDALLAAGVGPTFDLGESLIPTEHWLVTDCSLEPEDIIRRVQYGCQGNTDCQDKPQEEFIATGASFELLAPDVVASFVSSSLPVCYADEASEFTIRLTNVGTAPATNLRYTIDTRSTAAGGMVLDLNSITIVNETTGEPVTGQNIISQSPATGCLAPGTARAVLELTDLDLGIGESLMITYMLSTDCACTNTQIRNVFSHVFRLEVYDDLCDKDFRKEQTIFPSASFDAYLNGFGEASASTFDGGESCVTYYVTDVQLDWLNENFPNSALTAAFVLPCGTDYVPGSFVWRDASGLVFPASSVSYSDNDSGVDDILEVTFVGGDRPAGFDYSGGSQFDFCLMVDCEEKPEPTCGAASFDVVLDASFEFTVDPMCSPACEREVIWNPADLALRLVCPVTDDDCICDGLTFDAFDLERINFGLPDSNNDQVADGALMTDELEFDRFLAGDSIRVTLQGTVSDADNSQNFDYGFVSYPFSHDNFTPLSASVTIVDASDANSIYICPAVPILPDYENQRLLVDFSPGALNAFGCGLPVDFSFNDGDSIAVVFEYKEENIISGTFQGYTYQPDFYLSEVPFEAGAIFQCNPLVRTMTQIGVSSSGSGSFGNFGACEIPNWSITYDRVIGGAGIDEFPYEIRRLGIPERLVFNKPAEFSYVLDAWDLVFQQPIAPRRNIVDSRQTPGGIPAQFFSVDGDEVTVLIRDYLVSLVDAAVSLDEGYRIVIYPRIQGTCASEERDFSLSYQFFETVEANLFGMEQIANPVVTRQFSYLGAAELIVISDLDNIRLCSANEMALIRVRNLRAPEAANAFLYAEPTGDVLINRVEDAITGDEIAPNAFGLYELETIAGVGERELKVFFTKNSCGDERLDFIAGWGCTGYPETINDAVCQDPSAILLSNAGSGVSMVIRTPEPAYNEIDQLCTAVPYEVEMLSTSLGFVRDMVLYFTLPPGQTYVPGTMMFSNPVPRLGGSYVPIGDPVEISENYFRLDISGLDPILENVGLVGAKDPQNSLISIKFDAETVCGYVSGGRARFVLTSNNSCGDPLPNVRRLSGRIRIRQDEPRFRINVGPSAHTFNACNLEEETTSVDIIVRSGQVSSDLDSIRIVLPTGLNYIPDSYVPGSNAHPGSNPPVIREEGGQTVLLWPFLNGLVSGNRVQFDIGLITSDEAQLCGRAELLIEAFTAFEEECDGEVCRVGASLGRNSQRIIFQKPSFDFTSIDGSIELHPTDGTAVADFSIELLNLGFESAVSNTITVDIYEDVNNNGAFDDGLDVFLFQLDTTLTEVLLPGGRITISDQAVINAASICTVIGVITPEQTCTCSEVTSETYRPEIIIDFENEFEVCSGETIALGPMAIPGYEFEWISVNGSDLDNLATTVNTPTVFTAPLNTSGGPVFVEYLLRASNAPCFTDEIVRITILPALAEIQNISACIGDTYQLPTITDSGASNFVWSPQEGLTISPDGRLAAVNNVSTSATYTLMYDNGEAGCAASFTVNLNALNCGTTNTALGDTAFFDFNEDGLQSIGEPGIAGVTVNLIDGNTGAVIGTSVTNEDGFYIFDMLPAGNYAVEFIPQDGFVPTINNAGGDDANDSDADPISGITPSMFLPLDEQDFTIDAGFIPDCSLSVDLLISACVISGDTLTRQVQVSVSWDGNPYTYDQFGDGNDTLDVNFLGQSIPIVISELTGDSIVIDTLLRPAATVDYAATASFREASNCEASTTSGPLAPCFTDLALTKGPSLIQPTPVPYTYGDLICMDIVVYNQGSQTVQNVQVFDSLPEGLSFDMNNSPGWINIEPLQLYTFENPIAPGASATATLCATLEMTTGDLDAYTNIAEINSFQDTMGNDWSDFDEDSTPDMDFSNDPGGSPESPSDDVVDGDGSGTPGDMNPDGDEDDSDPFFLEVFDLALVKTLDSDPIYVLGDLVTYTFSVINQGNVIAENIRVTDYLPPGLSVTAGNSPLWGAVDRYNASFDTVSTVIPGPLLPGDTAQVSIEVQLVYGNGELDLINQAEITGATGPGGLPVDDVDSNTDTNPNNDPGGVPDTESDNFVEGDGTGTVGSNSAATDEDDADPAILNHEAVALGSTVFADENDNGVQDPGEFGLPGVVVDLYVDANGDGVISTDEETSVATVATDEEGNYLFDGLIPGNYQVLVGSGNFSQGMVLSNFGTSSTDVTGTATDNSTDGDDNGFQEGGEFTFAISPLVTLIPGEEEVDEAFQGGDQDINAGIEDANGNMTVDFGFIPDVSIGSTVFVDFDDNGMQDVGESGLPAVPVELYFDANNNGIIDNGEEITPFRTMVTNGEGNYFFGGLDPGNYQVQIPETAFANGGSLEYLPASSTDIATTPFDNAVDSDDNGVQNGGDSTRVVSPLINLQRGEEITDAQGETGQGTEADIPGADSSGDMTVDFGFVCELEIIGNSGPVTTCSTKPVNTRELATIVPEGIDGLWSSTGDGTFLDANGNLVSPHRYSEVVFYQPGTSDAKNGTVMLTLVSDPAGVCPQVSFTIEVVVLKVDCGASFWDGQ